MNTTLYLKFYTIPDGAVNSNYSDHINLILKVFIARLGVLKCQMLLWCCKFVTIFQKKI